MKKIGLIGGMSWESTVLYYEHINLLTHKASAHCAKIVVHGMDFTEVTALINQGNHEGLCQQLITVARQVEDSGADCLLICSNAVHHVADEVQAALSIPLLHITDIAAARMKEQGIQKAALLGTKHTMEHGFYQERLHRHGIEAIVPEQADRDIVQAVIFEELTKGTLSPHSKAKLLGIVHRLAAAGAEGIVLGCTELPLLLSQGDTPVPLFDTAALHAEQAVQFALSAPQAAQRAI